MEKKHHGELAAERTLEKWADVKCCASLKLKKGAELGCNDRLGRKKYHQIIGSKDALMVRTMIRPERRDAKRGMMGANKTRGSLIAGEVGRCLAVAG